MSELRARDPLLFWTGAAMLLTLLVVTLISIGDHLSLDHLLVHARNRTQAADFFGMHALQALPILGFLFDRGRMSQARNAVIAVSALWLAIMVGLLAQAFSGRPLAAL